MDDFGHEFVLLREGEYRYEECVRLPAGYDALVTFPDDPLRYLEDTLSWIPTINPAVPGLPVGRGLNWYGPTIINHTGGDLFRHVCASWAHLFSRGPERLTLRGAYGWPLPFKEMERVMTVEELMA